jgi:hypothetical protein
LPLADDGRPYAALLRPRRELDRTDISAAGKGRSVEFTMRIYKE